MDTKIVVPVLMPVLDLPGNSEYEKGRENLFHSLKFAGVETDPLIFRDKRGVGFVQSFNRGVEILLKDAMIEDHDWKWLCLWMADMRCDQYGWLKRLIEVGDSDYKPGFVGCSMRTGARPQHNSKPGMRPFYEPVTHLAFGGCIIYRELLETVGLLNKDYVHYGADYELQNLAREQGWSAIWVHDVWIEHDWTPKGFPRWYEQDQKLYYSRWDREGKRLG